MLALPRVALALLLYLSPHSPRLCLSGLTVSNWAEAATAGVGDLHAHLLEPNATQSQLQRRTIPLSGPRLPEGSSSSRYGARRGQCRRVGDTEAFLCHADWSQRSVLGLLAPGQPDPPRRYEPVRRLLATGETQDWRPCEAYPSAGCSARTRGRLCTCAADDPGDLRLPPHLGTPTPLGPHGRARRADLRAPSRLPPDVLARVELARGRPRVRPATAAAGSTRELGLTQAWRRLSREPAVTLRLIRSCGRPVSGPSPDADILAALRRFLRNFGEAQALLFGSDAAGAPLGPPSPPTPPPRRRQPPPSTTAGPTLAPHEDPAAVLVQLLARHGEQVVRLVEACEHNHARPGSPGARRHVRGADPAAVDGFERLYRGTGMYPHGVPGRGQPL